MQMFHNATIDCDNDTAAAYKGIEIDSDDVDADGKYVGDYVEFPIEGALVTHMGSRVSIMVPRRGKADLVLDRLVRAGEAKKQSNGKSFTISGTSEYLHMMGLEDAEAVVTFTIKEHSMMSGSEV